MLPLDQTSGTLVLSEWGRREHGQTQWGHDACKGKPGCLMASPPSVDPDDHCLQPPAPPSILSSWTSPVPWNFLLRRMLFPL